jgi:hypothetical protein
LEMSWSKQPKSIPNQLVTLRPSARFQHKRE